MSNVTLHPEATGVEAEVCKDIAARQRKGVEKYGVSVEANPISQREWLRHAYEETLDLAIYLKKIIGEAEAHALLVAELGHVESYVRELRRCIRDLVRNSQDGIRNHGDEIRGIELAEKPLRTVDGGTSATE